MPQLAEEDCSSVPRCLCDILPPLDVCLGVNAGYMRIPAVHMPFEALHATSSTTTADAWQVLSLLLANAFALMTCNIQTDQMLC